MGAFAEDGYVVVRSLVDVAPLLDLLGGAEGPIVPVDDPDVPGLAGLASSLLGGPVSCFGATFLVKPPFDGLPALWHQDGFPWRERLAGAPAVTAWVALDASTPASGGLRVIPGSHRLEAQPLAPSDEPSLFGAAVDPAFVDESLAVDLVLAPGDVSAHHPNLLHSSGPNPSPSVRRALAVRYRLAA